MADQRRKEIQLDLFMDSSCQEPATASPRPATVAMLSASLQDTDDDFMCGARFIETAYPWDKRSQPDPK